MSKSDTAPLNFFAGTHFMLQLFGSSAWSVCSAYSSCTPRPTCQQLKDRHGSLLEFGCRQSCVLDEQWHHEMNCIADGKNGGHDFFDDAVTSVAQLTFAPGELTIFYFPPFEYV